MASHTCNLAENGAHRCQRERYESIHQLCDSIRRDPVPAFEVASTSAADQAGGFNQKQKVIIITDIGSDADDAIALLSLFALPGLEFELLGIVCCFGEVLIRQKLCEKLLTSISAALPRPVPVLAGSVAPLGGCTPWHGGWEGHGILPPTEIERLRIGHLDTLVNLPTVLAEYGSPGCSLKQASTTARLRTAAMRGGGKLDDFAAASFIKEQVAAYPKQVSIAVLGAATDLALAMRMDPTLAGNVQRIAFMGLGIPRELLCPWSAPVVAAGNPYQTPSSQNVRCDVVAAHEVMSSDAHVLVVSGTLTRGLIGPVHKTLQHLLAAPGLPFGKGLRRGFEVASANVRDWCTKADDLYWHDPLTLVEAVNPGYFLRYVRGHFFVHVEDGRSTFVLDPQRGRHLAAFGISMEAHGEFPEFGGSNPGMQVAAFQEWMDKAFGKAIGSRSELLKPILVLIVSAVLLSTITWMQRKQVFFD